MVYKIEHYQELAEKMIKADKERNSANDKYDAMDHVEWTAPKQLRDIDGFREVPSLDPHDVINTGVRVLSALKERPTLQPLADNQATKELANNNERVLAWEMSRVNYRRQGTVQKSVVRSALKYDEVCAQIIDLDYQIKNKEAFGGDTKREKAARRYGRFAVNIYHPNDVHVEHSTYMPEAVLLCQKREAKDVMREWGTKAKRLKKAADNNEKVNYYDYMDYDVHVIWSTVDKSDEKPVVIMNEEHNMPFLPWVTRVGGDTMESKQEHRRRPLLYSIMRSDLWYTLNVMNSIEASEVMWYTMAARTKEEGPIPESTTEVDYGTPGRTIKVTPGNTLDSMPPPGLDPSLIQEGDRIRGQMAKSTVANVLQGGDVAPGTAFASLNLQTQTAIGSLKPAKELAEYALADIYTMFLLYAHYTENDIQGYGTGKADFGKEYVIEWDTINPEAIYMSVELTPDVPLDRMQKANVAMMLVQAGFYPKERALEDMGVTDPDEAIKTTYFEQIMAAYVQNYIQMMMAQSQMGLQMQAQEQQMGMQAIQNQMAGAPGGDGFNPELGGLPAQMGVPGATREGVTGEDRLGNEAFFGGAI